MLYRRSPETIARAMIGHHPYALNRRDRRAMQAMAGRPPVQAELVRLKEAGVKPRSVPPSL